MNCCAVRTLDERVMADALALLGSVIAHFPRRGCRACEVRHGQEQRYGGHASADSLAPFFWLVEAPVSCLLSMGIVQERVHGHGGTLTRK